MAAHRNAMGSFVDDKMKAMEEEMSRFEQEISGGPGDPQPPIFPTQTQHHRGHVIAAPPTATINVPGHISAAPSGPHDNRPSITATLRGFVPKPQMLTSVRPEVGPQLPRNFPQSRPSFIPHQVGRPMPQFAPRGFHPPPPPGMMHPMGPGPMGPGPMHRPPMQSAPTVISAPPTVYSAKPVKFKKQKTKETSEESKTSDSSTAATESPSESAQASSNTVQQEPMMPAMIPTQAMPQLQTHVNPAMNPYMMNPSMHSMTQQMNPQGSEVMMDPMQQQAGSSGQSMEAKKKDKKKKFVRIAANTTWEDDSLAEWDPNDFRIFCGDIGNEVTDELLTKAFCKYPSFLKAKVVRDKRSNKTKGYGFVSFKDPGDFANAMRELNGKYVGNRPIKLRKSNWKDRNIDTHRKKQKEKQRLGLR